MTILEQIEYIRQHSTLYAIVFRRAGVAMQFYEGRMPPERNWQQQLIVFKYYPTFEECVHGEYTRIAFKQAAGRGNAPASRGPTGPEWGDPA